MIEIPKHQLINEIYIVQVAEYGTQDWKFYEPCLMSPTIYLKSRAKKVMTDAQKIERKNRKEYKEYAKRQGIDLSWYKKYKFRLVSLKGSSI